MGVLKTILYIVLFYYLFKFLVRLFAPVIVQKAVEQVQKNMHNQSSQYREQFNAGETTYEAPKSQHPREKKKVGEYVDFEEIE